MTSSTDMRSRLMSIAYRILGTVADAEDAVQDAYLRYQTAAAVSSPEGFLVKVTTRICIDRLRERQRRPYIGPWVPEPVATSLGRGDSPLDESLTRAFLLMLEKLTPDERAAYLLRIVFGYQYAELADVMGKTEQATRQLVSRARGRLEQRDNRQFAAQPSRAEWLAERFVAACRAGDTKAVEELLSEDAEIHSDGGGKVSAARVVIRGRNRVARFLTGVFRKPWLQDLRMARVNGELGLIFVHHEVVVSVLSLWISDDIRAVYITVNPDKLSRWASVEIQ